MNLLSRWNPIRSPNRIEQLFDSDDLFRSFGLRPSLSREYDRAMDMRMDVSEDDHEYTVRVDMPGVRKHDIDVTIDGNQVTVRAEVSRETSSDKGKEIYSERYSGEAYRSFSLPAEVDGNHAKAAYDGGVLTLTLPKKSETTAKHLTIG